MNPNAISAFEYITILISIILGLGITQVLSSVAEVLHHSHKVKFYWPHTIWVLIILFLHVQEWFIIYELKNYPVWKLPGFLFVILYPITLFLSAKLAFPLSFSDENLDLKTYYFTAFPRIFYLFATCILLSVLFNVFFLKAGLLQQSVLLIPLVLFTVIAFKKIETEWLHQALSITVVLFIIVVTIAEVNAWYIK